MTEIDNPFRGLSVLHRLPLITAVLARDSTFNVLQRNKEHNNESLLKQNTNISASQKQTLNSLPHRTQLPHLRNTESSLNMDFIPEYLRPLISQHPLLTNLTTAPEILSTHLSTLRTTYLDPYILSPLSSLLTSSTPDLVSVFLLLLILFLSLKILDYTRRMVLFWVWLVFRVVFWGVILAVGYWVYSVGVERAGMEAGRAFGVVKGAWEEFERGVDGSAPGGQGFGREL